MPFAGFKDFADCVQKQKQKGKDDMSAKKICGSVKSKVEDTKQLEVDILKLEIQKDNFIMDIAKSLITKMASKLAAKPSPNVDDVRTLNDLVWMYRSEKRDNEPKGVM